MSWAEYERTLATVNKTQQFRTVLFPTTTLLPQISWLNHRHRHLDRTGVVHLFTHDVFDFFRTRTPVGSQVYNPEASLRIIPARSIS